MEKEEKLTRLVIEEKMAIAKVEEEERLRQENLARMEQERLEAEEEAKQLDEQK